MVHVWFNAKCCLGLLNQGKHLQSEQGFQVVAHSFENLRLEPAVLKEFPTRITKPSRTPQSLWRSPAVSRATDHFTLWTDDARPVMAQTPKLV